MGLGAVKICGNCKHYDEVKEGWICLNSKSPYRGKRTPHYFFCAQWIENGYTLDDRIELKIQEDLKQEEKITRKEESLRVLMRDEEELLEEAYKQKEEIEFAIKVHQKTIRSLWEALAKEPISSPSKDSK